MHARSTLYIFYSGGILLKFNVFKAPVAFTVTDFFFLKIKSEPGVLINAHILDGSDAFLYTDV